MTHEYDDPVSIERLDYAAGLVFHRRSRTPSTSLNDIAAAVVHEVFCSCVTDGGDAVEGHRLEIHSALIAEVVQRAARLSEPQVSHTSPPDAVSEASEESFPASDPPAWIWRDHPKRHSQ